MKWHGPATPLAARDFILLALACLGLFVAISPTLPWLEFASGGENLLVATALESERTGNWLMPTLNAEPRIAKPPLPTWIAGAAITESTARGLGSSDPAVRTAALSALAWQARWPFLLCFCLMALAAFELGRVLTADRAVAWFSFAACASSVIVMRAARAATTDISLAMLVAVANVFIAHALIKNRWWFGSLCAGGAIGLAMMCKGPVVFLQTLLPAVVFILYRKWGRRRDVTAAEPLHVASSKRVAAAVLAGALIAVLVGFSWYAAVYLKNPDVWNRWRVELLREGATGIKPGHWYNYIAFIPLMTPWMVLFLAGCGVILVAIRRGVGPHGAVFALLMVIVPIVAMSFFRDRKERYLLPMATPAAVVVGVGVAALRRDLSARRRDDAVESAHWIILSAIAVGVPIAGGLALKTVDGAPWYSTREWIITTCTGGAIAIGAIAWARRTRGRLVFASVVLMLCVQTWFIWGYRNSREGRSEMKPMADLVWSTVPDARVFTTGSKRLAPLDLAIYLNREVVWTENVPSPIEPGQHHVMVVRQDEDEPDPPTAPPGWRELGRFRRDNDFWHGFVSP